MGPLFLQHETALREILLRTNASDHPALRCVCGRFRDFLSSPEFRRFRVLGEFAEVNARVCSRVKS